MEVDVPGAEETLSHASTIVFSDACAFHAERLAERADGFSKDVYDRMTTGLSYSAVDYSRAVRAREAWRRTLAGLFEDIDILASPTAPADPPPVVDDRSLLEATGSAARNTYAGAHGAIPGLSVPCGFSAAGLPVGLQLEAARWREPLLLCAGVTYQSETGWHLARPGESGAG